MTKIKFFKTIFSIFFITLLALLYVHQEVEITKASFGINRSRRNVSFLLDQYRSLVYNLSQLESPKRIEETLSANKIILCMTQKENIRRFESVSRDFNREGYVPEQKASFLAGIFDRFSVKAEAKSAL